MKKTIAIFVLFLASLLALSGCKSGCGCHGDPFGEVPVNVEMSDVA